MNNLDRRLHLATYIGLLSLVFGIFVSVSIPSLFHILAIIPAFYFSYQAVKKGEKLPYSAYALIGLILTGYVSNILNLHHLNDVSRSFGKQKYFIFGILSIFLFREHFKSYLTRKRINLLLNTFFFTIFAAAIFGTFKYRYDFNLLKMAHEYTEQSRVGGFTGIMRYGYGMSFVLTLMTGLALYRSRLKFKISSKWFYAAFIFGFAGFILSFTRGAMLGYFCSLPFILWFYNRKYGKICFVAVGLIVTLIIGIMFTGGNTSSRFLTKITQSSNLKRLSQYETSLLAFKERPILGQGVNQFSSECVRIKDENQIWWQDYCHRIGFECEYEKPKNGEHYCGHSHNIFLEMMANTGMIGLLFFILWIVLWAIEVFKRHDLVSALYLPFLANFLVASQFEMVFDANNSFMIFLLYPLSFIRKEDLGIDIKNLFT